MLLDLAWGDLEGQIPYHLLPPFINGKAKPIVKNPDGQRVLRRHDTQQLKTTLKCCRERR